MDVKDMASQMPHPSSNSLMSCRRCYGFCLQTGRKPAGCRHLCSCRGHNHGPLTPLYACSVEPYRDLGVSKCWVHKGHGNIMPYTTVRCGKGISKCACLCQLQTCYMVPLEKTALCPHTPMQASSFKLTV